MNPGALHGFGRQPSAARQDTSSVGDIKPRALVELDGADALHVDRGEHWLKTGTYIAYDPAVHAHLLTRPNLLRMASLAALNGVVWTGSRYVHYPSGSGAHQVRSTWDGADTPTTSSPGAGLALVLTAGANAGRVIVIANNSNRTLDVAATAWTNASGTLGTNFGATKPDGSLVVAMKSTISPAAGDVQTSANGGQTWTSQTPTGFSGGTVYEAFWSQLLNEFIAAVGSSIWTSADGIAWSSAVTSSVGGNHSPDSSQTGLFAETPTALFLARRISASYSLYRYKAGAWALLSSAPAGVRQVRAFGSTLYATSASHIWRSTDDGDTWTRGYRVIGAIATSADFRVVNGRVISSVAGSTPTWFGVDDPVGQPPGAVGVPAATASLVGSTSETANFVRIK